MRWRKAPKYHIFKIFIPPMYFSLLIYIWIDIYSYLSMYLRFLATCECGNGGLTPPQLNYCKVVGSERSERSRQWRNYIGLQNSWLWLFHVTEVVSRVRSLWTAERLRTAGWFSRTASSNAQGQTLPCAGMHKQIRQTSAACLKGEFLSQLTWTMKYMESVNSDSEECKNSGCREKEIGKPKLRWSWR